MKARAIACLFMSGGVILAACNPFAPSEEARFFEKNTTRDQRIAALKAYPVAEQWQIYRYGMHDRKLGPIELASVVAQGGHQASALILKDISSNGDDLDYVAAIFVMSSIQKTHTYDLCADVWEMQQLRAFSRKIRSDVWQDVYGKELSGLCVSTQRIETVKPAQ